MFKWSQNKVEICCKGLLMAIAGGQYEITGTIMKYPSVKNMGSGYYMKYCPDCGEKLIPEGEVNE